MSECRRGLHAHLRSVDLPPAGVGALTVLSAAPVTNRTATWTYNYNNVAIPNPGTYGAAGTGRVTYTAATP